MFIAFYTVKIVYICVFITCFTVYCLCDTQMIHGIYTVFARVISAPVYFAHPNV